MRLDPVKLLIVDDVEENLNALEALLGGDGIELLRAQTGPEALELLLLHEVALALLDVQMPGMDGFELAELMRGTERTRGIPIIFLTAVATDERRRFRGYETGAVDYLLKPVDAHIVRSKVEIFCELARQRQELARQRDALAAALNRLQAHGDNSPLAIVEFDPDLHILAWSQGAERLFGRSASQAVGRRPAELHWLPQEDDSALAELVADMARGRRLREMCGYRVMHADGRLFDCEWYCSALLDGSGRLSSINVQILDVTERKRAEETQRLLIGELNHRVKNTLASVQAIATQTLRHSSGPSEFAPIFIGRIHALARAHSLLSGTTWKGANLRDMVEAQLQIGTIDAARLDVSGPDLDLAAEPALHLALVLHELATNANKYGALSNSVGKVQLGWRVENDMLEIDWIEIGGPPVSPPSRRGFGTALIERSIKAERGTSHASYGPEGVHWKLRLPIGAGASSRSKIKSPEAARCVRPASAPTRSASRSVEGRRFLVIEDEPLVALELVSILRDAGAEVIGPAATADQALEFIGKIPIDGALLDGNLQGEMVDDIAQALVRSEIPFLFVSGYEASHLPAGFTAAALEKPFDPGKLVAAAADLIAVDARCENPAAAT
ncbi:response regulator [Sphingosinicella sp. CPCC 101087]|uniref:response regulator n=1 Tax=Sphingosinicella sp. CPCC 101087 TaxID=2497754 RepID=UPI00101C07F4|nr:response regulator [Sphingosinicella sp. CPCC 101087]